MTGLTFAIGDIHGCLDKLRRLLAVCEARAGGGPACPARGVRARSVPAYFETALGGCNMPVMLCRRRRRPSACLEPPHVR